jgi:hypothetical protein
MLSHRRDMRIAALLVAFVGILGIVSPDSLTTI